MRAQRTLWGLSALALLGAVCGLVLSGDGPPANSFRDAVTGRSAGRGLPDGRPMAERLLEMFPMESLEGRLERLAPGTGSPSLGEAARTNLATYEQLLSSRHLRIEALRALHEGQLDEFVAREGFGLSRLPTPAGLPTHFFLSDEPRSFAQRPSPISESSREGDGWTPSFEDLTRFHIRDQVSFADPAAFGYVKDLRSVAGFRGHAFRVPSALLSLGARTVSAGMKPTSTRWRIERLELVSLIKQETPAVYVSEHLPRMDELQQAKTRPLDDFERRSLTELVGGQDLLYEEQLNDIRMVGAVRAATQCLECHVVKRGALLGAFSYRLFRDPPLKAAQPDAVPVTKR